MCPYLIYALLILAVLIRYLVLYCTGRCTGVYFFTIFPIFTVLLWGFLRLFTYPVVHDNSLEMRWMLLPFMNRRFNFNEIERIVAVKNTIANDGYNITIIRQDGKRHKYHELLCMSKIDFPLFFKQLRDAGVNVDIKMKFLGK